MLERRDSNSNSDRDNISSAITPAPVDMKPMKPMKLEYGNTSDSDDAEQENNITAKSFKKGSTGSRVTFLERMKMKREKRAWTTAKLGDYRDLNQLKLDTKRRLTTWGITVGSSCRQQHFEDMDSDSDSVESGDNRKSG